MARREKAYSIALPKRPFLRGVARLFDWGGALDHDVIQQILERHRNPPPIPTVEESMRDTWEAVGQAMRWAIGEHDKTSRDNETDSDRQTVEVEWLRSTRTANLLAMMRGIDADEKSTRRALSLADYSVLRALTRYKKILGEQNTR